MFRLTHVIAPRSSFALALLGLASFHVSLVAGCDIQRLDATDATNTADKASQPSPQQRPYGASETEPFDARPPKTDIAKAPNELWCVPSERVARFPFAASVAGVAAVSDGHVFVGRDSADGNGIAWRVETASIADGSSELRWIASHDALLGLDLVTVSSDDDQIVVVGTTRNPSDGRQVRVVALDHKGGLNWARTLSPATGPPTRQLAAMTIASGVAVSNVGIVVTGFYKGDSFAWRLDPQGTVLWKSVFESVVELTSPLYGRDRIIAVSHHAAVAIDTATGDATVVSHGAACQTALVSLTESGPVLGGAARDLEGSRGCVVALDADLRPGALTLLPTMGVDSEVVALSTARDGALYATVLGDTGAMSQRIFDEGRDQSTATLALDDVCISDWTPHAAVSAVDGMLATGADTKGVFTTWVAAQ